MSAGIRNIRVAKPPSPAPSASPSNRAEVKRRLFIVIATLNLALLWPLASVNGAQSWTVSALPSTVLRGTPTTITMTATNTSTTAADAEAIGCIRIRIPGPSTVSSAAILVPPLATSWTITSVSGNPAFVTLQASTDADRMRGVSPANQIVFELTASAGAMGNWVANEYQDIGCTVSYGQPINVVLTISGTPIAAPDAYGVAKNVPLSVSAPGVLANDIDPDGDPITAQLVTGPLNGVLSLGADGSFSYTPSPGYVGADTFTYRATDGGTQSAPALVVLTVTNTAPSAAADAYSVAKGTTLNAVAPGVLSNDTDANGDSLTAQLVSGTSNGALSLSPNGSFSYTPTPGYVGADSFTYRASDGTATSGTATVSITIVNAGPVANPDGPFAATEDTTFSAAAPGVLSNDADGDGDPLTAELVGQASNGTVALNADGSFTYTPVPNFSGSDSFTYRARDPNDVSPPAIVSIDVAPVNDRPTATDDAYGTPEDTPLVVPLPGVLVNDGDVDGDVLSAQLVSGPSNGALTLDPNGSFVYTPDPDFNGSDAFTYQAADGALASLDATVTLTVSAVNDAPSAAADAFAATEDVKLIVPAVVGVLANDWDADGDPLSAALVATTGSGTLVLASDGSFTYVPAPEFSGTDTFTYRATDGVASSAPVTATIVVAAVNDPPTARADAYAVAEDGTLSVAAPGVLANDSDPDGPTVSALVDTLPGHGTLALAPTGAFTYLPDPDWHGTDTFRYRATDGLASSAPATVSITVQPDNDPPVAVADAASVTAGSPALIDVLANDIDIDGDSLSIASFSQPVHGTVSRQGSQLVYLADARYVGADSFSYRVTDGSASSSATVSLLVLPAPATPTPAPTASPATPAPTASPTPSPTASATASATATPSPSQTPEPSPTPSAAESPQPSETPGPAVVLPTKGPLSVAPLPAGKGLDVGIGQWASLLSFGWFIPTFAFGAPGLLIVLLVALQVTGALAWMPAVRRSLGSFGMRRRRRKESTAAALP